MVGWYFIFIYYTYFYLLHHTVVQIYRQYVGGPYYGYIFGVDTPGNSSFINHPGWLLIANC